MALDFPVPTTVGQTYTYGATTWQWNGNAMFELALFASPNGSDIKYEFSVWTTGGSPTKFAGTLSSSLPTNTIFIAPRGYHSAGGTSTVMGFGLMGIYLESDY